MLFVFLFVKIAKKKLLKTSLVIKLDVYLYTPSAPAISVFIHKYSTPTLDEGDEFKRFKCIQMFGSLSEPYLNDPGFLNLGSQILC